MDWDREYELLKADGIDPVAGPSRHRAAAAAPRADDDDVFNDVPMAPAPPDDREPDFLEEDVIETPLEQLTRHWMNERHAPDILPAQEALLAALLDHLRRQVGRGWACQIDY